MDPGHESDVGLLSLGRPDQEDLDIESAGFETWQGDCVRPVLVVLPD